MKKENIICGVAAISLGVTLLVTPKPAGAGGAGCAVEVATGRPGPSCAGQIVKTTAPYAMAAGAYLRNPNGGYTYREYLQASKQYFQHPYRNAYQDVRGFVRR